MALGVLDVDRGNAVDELVELRGGRLRGGEGAEDGAHVAEGQRAKENGDEGLHDLATGEAALLAIVDGALGVVVAGLDDELRPGVGGHPVHGIEGEEHQAHGEAQGGALAGAGLLGVGEEAVVPLDLVLLAGVSGDGADVGVHLARHVASSGICLLGLRLSSGDADN